jgi:hypothetical protein
MMIVWLYSDGSVKREDTLRLWAEGKWKNYTKVHLTLYSTNETKYCQRCVTRCTSVFRTF